jgi:fimbrial chaperone protein
MLLRGALPLAVLLGALAPAQSRALNGFSVDPVHMELKPSQNAAVLTVANYNAEAMFMQVRVYRWEHRGSEDVLSEAEASEAALVTPPLFRLAPNGGSQVIRVGFAKPPQPLAQERQWRVIVEEVVKPASRSTAGAEADAGAATDAAESIAISVHVRVSLPLLQRPQQPHQDLQWSLEHAHNAQLRLTASNLGSVTERLDDIVLGPPDEKVARLSGPFYLFPGESRSFDLHADVVPAPGNVRLSLQGTARPLTRDLVLSAQ